MTQGDLLDGLRNALASQYTIDREIGRGGMATVYLAQDQKHRRSVALKVLHAELAESLGSERFRREIAFAAQLQHPHILTVLDSGETSDGLLWFTMPFVEGESLRGRLRRERQLPSEDAIRVTREIAQALDYAHRHGVIHRDIKPENILLTVDGQALVADFGIARALTMHTGEHTLTGTGMAVGTPAYMSPEQASGDSHSGRALRCVRSWRGVLRDAGWRAAVHRSDVASDPREGAVGRSAVGPPHEASGSRRGGCRHSAGARAGAGGPVRDAHAIRAGSRGSGAIGCDEHRNGRRRGTAAGCSIVRR